jgi:predicted component of type VI protein secretion system
VQAVCLPSPHEDKKLNLATLGANARRATEDSTTVAYLDAPNPRATRFVHPILETAQVPWISASSGKAAMARLLKLIPGADLGSLRESLREDLNES